MNWLCRIWLFFGHKVYNSEGTRVPTPKNRLESWAVTMATSDGGYTCRRCNNEVKWKEYRWVIR